MEKRQKKLFPQEEHCYPGIKAQGLLLAQFLGCNRPNLPLCKI